MPSTFGWVCPYSHYNLVGELPTWKLTGTRLMHPSSKGWGIPSPTLVSWRQGFRLQQGTSVDVGMPKPTPSLKIVMTNFTTEQSRITTSQVLTGWHGFWASLLPSMFVEFRNAHYRTVACPNLAGMITLKFDANWDCFWWRISLHKTPSSLNLESMVVLLGPTWHKLS